MWMMAPWRSDFVNVVTGKKLKLLYVKVLVGILNRESRPKLGQQLYVALLTKTRSDQINASSVAPTKIERLEALVCRWRIKTLGTSQRCLYLRPAKTTGARMGVNVTQITFA